ncbi:MAG: DMT family transporter [Myxococcota bacterium]|nr:DMT family transporter [Myxococcota bacterium]
MNRSNRLNLFIAIVAISFAALFFRKAETTHPLMAAALRLTIAAVLLWPFTGKAVRRMPKKCWQAAIVCGVFYAVHFGAWVWSLALTTVAASVTLVTTTPIFLALVGLVTGRDKPNKGIWLSLALGCVGVALIGLNGLSGIGHEWKGDLLALVGCLGMAAYMLTVRRLGTFPLWPFITVAATVGAILLVGTAIWLDVPLMPENHVDFLWLSLAALVPQLIGHTALTRALRTATPTAVGLATIGEPVGATAVAWLWLAEVPSTIVLIGCTITLMAVLFALNASGPSSEETQMAAPPENRPKTST